MAARLGLADPGDAVGKTALEMPEQGAALALHQHDEAVLRSGEPQHYRARRVPRRRTGRPNGTSSRAFRCATSDGVVGIIGVFRDVTEQKRAEEKIQEAVRRRDQFLAMLSHELRNPLGAVVTATSLLQESDGRRTSGDALLGILERQSQQMARLLDDLLEVDPVTENKIELRKEVVDLRGRGRARRPTPCAR